MAMTTGRTFRQRLRHDLANLAMAHDLSAADVDFMLSEFDGAAARTDSRSGLRGEAIARVELMNDHAVREFAELLIALYEDRCRLSPPAFVA
jgi:hypothetical protein